MIKNFHSKVKVATFCSINLRKKSSLKAGLLLALFGGTSKYANDSAYVPVRGDPHVLVVGDPGLGKSQMLQSCHDVAPKSVIVTATGATTSGLTVSISKGNNFAISGAAYWVSRTSHLFFGK